MAQCNQFVLFCRVVLDLKPSRLRSRKPKPGKKLDKDVCYNQENTGIPPAQLTSTGKRSAPSKASPTTGKPIKLTGRVGTIKRKRQLRELVTQHERGGNADLFASTPFKDGQPTLKAR